MSTLVSASSKSRSRGVAIQLLRNDHLDPIQVRISKSKATPSDVLGTDDDEVAFKVLVGGVNPPREDDQCGREVEAELALGHEQGWGGYAIVLGWKVGGGWC